MAVTLKANQIKLKTQDGTYTSPVILSDTTTADHIAQVEAAITSAGEDQIDAIETAGGSQVSAIVNKGAETLASIPDDYETLEDDVADLKNAITNDTSSVASRDAFLTSPSVAASVSFDVVQGETYIVLNLRDTTGTNLRTTDATGHDVEVISSSLSAYSNLVFTASLNAEKIAVTYGQGLGGNIYIGKIGYLRENVVALLSSIAKPYSNTKKYAVGEIAIYQGLLKICTTAIQTSESFTPSHWTDLVIADKVIGHDKEIENASYNIIGVKNQSIPMAMMSGEQSLSLSDWEIGGINGSGVDENNVVSYRSKHYIALNAEKLTVTVQSGYSHTCNIIWYSKVNGVYNYVGKSFAFASSYTVTLNPNYYYRFVLTKIGATSIDDVDINKFTFTLLSSDTIANRYANEDILSPDYEIINLPTGVGTWQSIMHIGNEVWLLNESSAVGGTINGKIYRVTDDFSEFIGTINHNLGHVNSASYDEQKKRFLTGSASNSASDAPKIWIYENADQWLNISSGNNLDKAQQNVTEFSLSGLVGEYGSLTYISACWGEPNANGNRCIYINAGINTKWLRIVPKYGTDQGEYGTYTAASSGEYNGTFDLDGFYTYTNHPLPETIDSYVCQDLALYHGGIIEPMGHNCILAGLYMRNLSGVMRRKIIRMPYVDDAGDDMPSTQNEGIMIMDGYIYSGLSNATNPRLAKWQI